jgi:hypothetical protein
MGTKEDLHRRHALARKDDDHRKQKVAGARFLIREKRNAVQGKEVKKLLADDGLAPIEVLLHVLTLNLG